MLIPKDKNEIMEAMANILSNDNYMNFEKTASDNENKVIGDHIKKLISVADEMDKTGFSKQASQIDSVIQSMINITNVLKKMRNSGDFSKRPTDYLGNNLRKELREEHERAMKEANNEN